jgi:hypothetical protein
MPPAAKKATTPPAPTGADKPSTEAPKAAKKAAAKAAAPKRTSVKTQDGVEIGWVEG